MSLEDLLWKRARERQARELDERETARRVAEGVAVETAITLAEASKLADEFVRLVLSVDAASCLPVARFERVLVQREMQVLKVIGGHPDRGRLSLCPATGEFGWMLRSDRVGSPFGWSVLSGRFPPRIASTTWEVNDPYSVDQARGYGHSAKDHVHVPGLDVGARYLRYGDEVVPEISQLLDLMASTIELIHAGTY